MVIHVLRRCTVQRYLHCEGVGGGSNLQKKHYAKPEWLLMSLYKMSTVNLSESLHEAVGKALNKQ